MTVEHSREHPDGLKDWFLSRTGIAILVVVAVLGFLVYAGHTAHLLGAIPYLLLLACPLMHMFMHGHHDRMRHDREKEGG